MDRVQKIGVWLGVGAVVLGTVALIAHERENAQVAASQPLTPVWTPLQPVAGTFTIPLGATFAISDPQTDPNLSTLQKALTDASTAGQVTALQTFSPGSVMPGGWPASDPTPASSAWRATGAATKQFTLTPPAGTTVNYLVWLFAGVA